MGILNPDQRTYPTTATHGTAGGVAYGEHPGVALGTHIPTTQTTATGPAPNTAGPHRHDILNKLDPSVDSDMSKISTAAAAGTAAHTHNANTTHNNHNRHGVSPAIAAGLGAGLGGGAAHHHNNNNNHNNGLGLGHGAHNNGGLGGHGGGLGQQHQYRQNQAVPVTGASGATGPARNTAGPHQSDLANRLDPTVDSHTGLRN